MIRAWRMILWACVVANLYFVLDNIWNHVLWPIPFNLIPALWILWQINHYDWLSDDSPHECVFDENCFVEAIPTDEFGKPTGEPVDIFLVCKGCFAKSGPINLDDWPTIRERARFVEKN